MTRFRKRRQGGRRESSRRTAVVIGRWADDSALLRLEDGTTREVEVPERLRGQVDVGSRATVGSAGVDVEWVLGGEEPVRRSRFWRRTGA